LYVTTVLTRRAGPLEPAEVPEHIRIGQRVRVGGPLRVRAVQDLAHGNLQLLTGQGARYARYLVNLVRHVPGRQLRRERGADRVLLLVAELASRRGHHEQDQPALGAEPARIHHQAVADFFDGLDHAVQLAGAHAHAAAVERGVRAAVDDEAAVGQHLDPVAVPPDPGVHLEIALPVPDAVGIVPEPDGHRRHRLGDHQLADLADDWLAPVVIGLHLG